MTPTELLKRLRTKPTPEKLETVEQYRQHVISEQTGRAGSTKSPAKAEAAKRNGAKGGRPRKQSFIALMDGDIRQKGDEYFDGVWKPIPDDVIGKVFYSTPGTFSHRRPTYPENNHEG